MKRSLICVLAAVAAGCAETGATSTEPQEFIVPVFSHEAGAAHGYQTHLTGDQELPTPTDSRAQGQAIFTLSEDGASLHFKLVVANIENVTQAHIHGPINPATGTAGIVVWLYPSAPPSVLIPGRTQGVLAEGTITTANFMGGLANQPFSALIDMIEARLAYVNVHTSQFPPGEIRGDF